MKLIATLTAAPLLVLATAASADAPQRLSDAEYPQLVRCAVIEKEARAGSAFAQALREQRSDRSRDARWEAGQAEERVTAAYRMGSGEQKRALKAQLQGSCRALLGAGGGGDVQSTID